MSTLANHYRERAVALLATLYDADGAEQLMAYGPADEAEAYVGRLRQYAAIAPDARATVCREQLRGLRTGEEMILLHEVHPGWLVGVLEHESPRVVGLLLRHLPSRHVRYLMEHLPERITKRLPNVIDAFAVAPAILQLVRRRFEQHFVPIRPAKTLDTFGFADLGHLKSDDIESVIADLGITELALAFRALERQTLQIIFHRLPFRDAKALKERIEAFQAVDPLLERDAKGTIYEMTMEEGGSDIVLKAIGLHAVAKAIEAEHRAMIAVVRQKLSPKWGYCLARYVDTSLGRQHPTVIALRQRLILDRLAALSANNAIDPQWQTLIPGGAAAETVAMARPEEAPLPQSGPRISPARSGV